MKALVCEMCGSQDILKKDGVYVCQYCGTKYTVEEAKKMMVEGTVKVDNSDRLTNLYQVARRAKENNDYEGAAKYYDSVQAEDPTSWEACFYSTYFKALTCTIGSIRSAAVSVSNCLDTACSLVCDHISDVDEQKRIVNEIIDRCNKIANVFASTAKKHYNDIDVSIRNNYTQEFADRIAASYEILYNCGNSINTAFCNDTDVASLAARSWKYGIELHKKYVYLFADEKSHNALIQIYIKKTGLYDKNYGYNEEKKVIDEKIWDAKQTINSALPKKLYINHKIFWTGLFSLAAAIFIVAYFEWRYFEAITIIIIIGLFAFGLLLTIGGVDFNKNRVRIAINEKEKAKKDLEEAEQELKALAAKYGK